MKYFVFGLIFLSLLFFFFFSHLFILKFISDLPFVRKNIIYFRKVFLSLFIVSILSLFLRVRFSCGVLEYIFILGFFWIGLVLIMSFWCFIGEIFLFLFKKIDRRIIICLFLGVSLIYIIKATYEGIKLPNFNRITFKFDNLNKNYKIIFISDTHLSCRHKNLWFLKLYEKIKNSQPDVLVLVGDILEYGFKINDEMVRKIHSYKIPTIVVFGNHEYYFGINKASEIFSSLGYKILRNNSLCIGDINFIGLGDIITEDLSKQEVIEILSKHYIKNKLNILISHQPLYFEEISKNFDLIMISGHIHRGQIFPFHIFVRIFYKYFYGIYKKNNSVLIVTSGAGVWGPPMRFLADSEVVEILLKK